MNAGTTSGTNSTSISNQHHAERKGGHVVHGAPAERPQGNAPQSARGKQQGMGDHVPAFMMRPVRVP